jgi:hypothetical protein
MLAPGGHDCATTLLFLFFTPFSEGTIENEMPPFVASISAVTLPFCMHQGRGCHILNLALVAETMYLSSQHDSETLCTGLHSHPFV